ncbi:hypothetical protein K2173_004236 [Erythroxylum novogranatense]|uniref:Uncharacterized protein n=1 Tax=Erythroxylum novogranatense TaxID=1862640 RepID=A0AAV8U867_9ROSI|nr:hypothetical protein K2173_004236 [Erythroxylum novogranatense]
MDSSQNIRQRPRETDDGTTTDTTTMNRSHSVRTRRDKRMAMAKRGVRSLAIAVAVPLSLTMANIYVFGSSNAAYGAVSRPFWFPPLWVLHMTCMATTFLMSLSAWLVWAEGGFHKKPTAFTLYLAQLGLSLAWYPIAFWIGASWLGLVACLAMFGALVGCSRQFKEVNPIAGDLVKPGLAWAAFLAIVNLKLVSV